VPLERAEEAPEGDVLLRLQELVREEEDGVLDQQVSDELGERGWVKASVESQNIKKK
jgi:hypothetical protein